MTAFLQSTLLTRAMLVRLLVVLAALAIATLLVSRGSRAAFVATTDNTANSLGAGTVTLSDDDSASVLFNVTNLYPGETVENCIVVTYAGTIPDPSGVKLYSGGYTDGNSLDDWLNININEGTGGVFNNCTGFSVTNNIETGGDLAAFALAHSNYGNGAGVWDPSGTPESVTYRIQFTLDAATPTGQQGNAVTALAFTWEVQS